MPLLKNFDFISFNSRQHALYFDQKIKSQGYSTQIISTPKGVALGCGLSISFSPHLTPFIIDIYMENQVPIIGFFSMRWMGGHSQLTRIPLCQ